MKARLISALLVIALLVTVGVITAQADNATACDCASKKGVFVEEAVVMNAVCDAADLMTDVANATTCPYCGSDVSVTWQKMPTSGELSGHYYVDGTVDVTAAYTVSGATCIHLNGGTLQAASSMVFDFNNSSSLNIMGSGTVIGAGTSNASTIQVRAGTVRLMGGTYKHSSGTTATVYARTGDLYIAKGTQITADKDVKGTNLKILHCTVTMYGGEITNGTVTGSGGNVLINPTTNSHKAAFYMYGGEISGGNAKRGGNIAVVCDDGITTSSSQTTCKIAGGKIYDGEATEDGGNIYVLTKSKITFRVKDECEHHDVDIYGGSAKYGGNVYITQKYLKDTTYQTDKVYLWLRDADIYDGTATKGGGNIYVGDTGVYVEIGVSDEDDQDTTHVENGVAPNGGNLYVGAGGKVKIQYNATLTGGSNGVDESQQPKRSDEGGNIYCAGDLDIYGHVDGGFASYGGSVYCAGSNASVTLRNDSARTKVATIEDGTAVTYGGCVAVWDGATFTMHSGVIQNGTVTGQDGSCIYGRSGNVKLLGGTVSSDETTDKGSSRQGAVVLGGVKSSKAYPILTLGGDATVTSSIDNDKESVWVNNYAKLTINSGYTGSIKLRVQSDMPSYGEQFGLNSWNAEADTIAPEVIVSAAGNFGAGGTVTLLQRSNAPAIFVAAGEGLLVPNAKNSADEWVYQQSDFEDVNLYGGKITLTKDETLKLAEGATVTADLNGKTAVVNLAEGATSATFKGTNGSTANAATATLAAGVTGPAATTNATWNNAGYYDVALLADQDSNTYSYHKLEMAITNISLRPSVAGLYYTSAIATDETLEGMIESAGVLLGATNATGVDTLVGQMKAAKATDLNSEDAAFVGVAPKELDLSKVTSVLVQHIFKNDADNAARGEISVVGTPYVQFTTGDILVCQNVKSCSMKQFLDTANTQITDQTKLEALKTFCNTWNVASFGWTLPNILGTVPAETEV